MAGCLNYSIFKRYLCLAFCIAENLTAGIASPVFLVASLGTGRCFCFRLGQFVTESRYICNRFTLFAGPFNRKGGCIDGVSIFRTGWLFPWLTCYIGFCCFYMVRVIFASAGSGAAASVIIPCIDRFIPVMTIIHRYRAEGTVTRFIRYGDGILLISCRKGIVACVIRSCSNTVYQHGFQIYFFYCKGLFFAVNFSVCNSFDHRFRHIESCTIGTKIGMISGLIGNLHIVDEIHLILGGDAEFAVCFRPIGDGSNFRLG